MAINKDSNGYTIGFAFVIVVVVGTILAMLSIGLKPRQEKNAEIKKKIEILSAMLSTKEMESISRKNAEAEFDKYVNLDNAIVVDINGKVKESVKAFDVDIKSENRDKKLSAEDRNYPLFVCEKDGGMMYVIPVVGKGLWGPIWGNLCINDDRRTIHGVSFGHKGETPGLGAEITQDFFRNRWLNEVISSENGEQVKFEIVKDGSGSNEMAKVDGITGGTITSVGVQDMMNKSLAPYVAYFNTIK